MLPVAEPSLGGEELENLTEAFRSGWISSKGRYISEFENGFAGFCGRKYGVETMNGTVALHLSLVASGIRPGDEVIVPTFTFVASVNAIAYTGARPVFVDCDPRHWTMNPELVEKAVTKRTKGIMAVHIYGHPCDTEALEKIARKHKVPLFEDAAEAHGARSHNRIVGSFGAASSFSFYGNKLITTGEGGMVLTDSKGLLEKMRLLRDHGMSPKRRYWHDIIGYNYRMTNLQAAIGVGQLKKLEQFVEKKRHIASWYAHGLSQEADNGSLSLHPQMDWAHCSYWLYSILVEGKGKRDKLIQHLASNGIESRPFFIPIHSLPPYRSGKKKYPAAERISRTGLNLPSGVNLTQRQVEFVCETIKKGLR